MNKVNIQFGGMANIPDESVAQDGQMAVLMNMRHKGGELVPCQPPAKVLDNIGAVEQALYHANSKCWLFLRADGSLKAYKEDFSNAAKPVEICGEGVKSFALLGNIVVMNLENDVVYAIWRDNKFVYLGAVPMPPEMGIKTSGVVVSNKWSEPTDYKELESFHKSQKGLFDKCLDSLYKKGAYIDNAIFIVAVKFFDGTYRYSHWYFIRNEHKETVDNFEIDRESNFLTTAEFSEFGNHTFRDIICHIIGFRPEFSFDYDLSEWEDIIASVDVFSSASIMQHAIVANDTFGDTYCKKGVPLLRDEIECYSTFYKIAEYNLKGEIVSRFYNTSPSNLAAQEKLPVANRRDILSDKELVFNNKLHVVKKDEKPEIATDNVLSINGDDTPIVKDCPSYIEFKNGDIIHHTLKKYYNYKFLPYLISQPMKGIVRQEIKTENGIKLDVKYKDNPNMDMSVALNGSGEFDYWADYKVFGNVTNLYYRLYDAGGYYKGDLHFKPNVDIISFIKKVLKTDSIGFADWYEVQILENNIKISTVSESVEIEKTIASEWGISWGSKYVCNAYINISVKHKDALYTIDKFAYQTANLELPEAHKEPIANNILKVSAQDNPFYFPNEQTYMFDGDIKGLASNAEAISQGQFGQYPLFVFTDTGIWAMGVDTSGQGAYTTQSPFSREVCNGAICPVSGGVVFSTDKGVMVISGGQVADLSTALDGFEVDFFKYNAEMWNAIFAKAGKGAVVNTVPIREYIKGAVIAYNYHYNEIIVSNNKKGYSYVYSLTNKVWSVIDVVFDLTTNKYPELVVFDKVGKMYTFEDGAAKNKVVAITRPFTLGSIDFKRIRQAGLRTTFNGQLNFYVLGSIDGATFSVITGKEYPSKNGNEPTDVTRRDLITEMSRSKQCKYFTIAVVGDIEGRISIAELLVDEGLANNKLR